MKPIKITKLTCSVCGKWTLGTKLDLVEFNDGSKRIMHSYNTGINKHGKSCIQIVEEGKK